MARPKTTTTKPKAAPKPRAGRVAFRAILTPAPFMPRVGLVLGPLAVELLPAGGKRAPGPVEGLAASFKMTNEQNSRAWVGAWKAKATRTKTSATVQFTRSFGRLTVEITGTTDKPDDVLNDDAWSWSWKLSRKAEARKSIDAVSMSGQARSFERAALGVLSQVRGVEAETCGLAALVRAGTKARPFEARPGEVAADQRFVEARAENRPNPRSNPPKKPQQAGLAFG